MSPNLNVEVEKFPRSERPVESFPSREEEAGRESQRVELPQERRPVKEESFGVVTAPNPKAKSEESNFANVGDPQIAQIEQVLAEHIDELYARLPESKKAQFKSEGEEAARRINDMFFRAKVRVKEILSLIISWLSLIPGVSRFFIEQQAEIKTNKILALHDSTKRKI